MILFTESARLKGNMIGKRLSERMRVSSSTNQAIKVP